MPRRDASLTVFLHGGRIGRIRPGRSGRTAFEFDPAYLERARPPVLSLSLLSGDGLAHARPRGYAGRLPPFFSNLLPEGALRWYLAKAAKVSPADEAGLLRALGRDLPGAVTVRPEAGSAAREEPEAPPGGALRFSLPGAQFKLSAKRLQGGGFTIPARGLGGDWIVKFPGRDFPGLARNEFAMMALARASGIPVPETRLVPAEEIAGLPPGLSGPGRHAYLVRRFDRAPGGGKVHMEDFAQVFGQFPERKYERRSYANIAAAVRLHAGAGAALQFTRQVAFSMRIGNGDLHLKNASLLYADPLRPLLSPAYDLVCTRAHIPGDDLALGFGGSKAMDGPSPARVRQYARAAGLDPGQAAAAVRDAAERAAAAWRGLPERDLLPKAVERSVSRMLAGGSSPARAPLSGATAQAPENGPEAPKEPGPQGGGPPAP